MKQNKNLNDELSDLEDFKDLRTLQEKYRALWIQNKRLSKQNDILKVQINEKDRIINELKSEIDSTILEDTKNKLQYIRLIESEVNEKTQDEKHKYLQKITQVQMQLENVLTHKLKIQREIQFQRQHSMKLTNKLRGLKDHMVTALDQKQLIINQLVRIVTKVRQVSPQKLYCQQKKTQKIRKPKVQIKRNT